VKLGTALRRAGAALALAGIDDAPLEARLLMGHALGTSPRAMLNLEAVIDPTLFDTLLARRLAHEPLALITGRQGFWTLDLAVSPATLIPRADSETLIEAALAAFPDRDAVRAVLDLGTGTGCLLLAALSEFSAAWGLGIDVSPAAAALAASNAAECGLAQRATFLAADWDAALQGTFDLVLANPPYIAACAIAGLMPEVAQFEPMSALDGGVDGLDAYRRLLPGLPRLLRPGGLAVLELGHDQADAVTTLAIAAGFSRPALRTDLGGHARVLSLCAASP
jgi:release factor glutamine methyltransferase